MSQKRRTSLPFPNLASITDLVDEKPSLMVVETRVDSNIFPCKAINDTKWIDAGTRLYAAFILGFGKCHPRAAHEHLIANSWHEHRLCRAAIVSICTQDA